MVIFIIMLTLLHILESCAAHCSTSQTHCSTSQTCTYCSTSQTSCSAIFWSSSSSCPSLPTIWTRPCHSQSVEICGSHEWVCGLCQQIWHQSIWLRCSNILGAGRRELLHLLRVFLIFHLSLCCFYSSFVSHLLLHLENIYIIFINKSILSFNLGLKLL